MRKVFTVKEMAEYRQIIYENNLVGWEVLLKYTDLELTKICNGIGGTQMPKWLVFVINRLNPTLIPASILHDVQWFDSDGTKPSFLLSNAEFEVNGILMSTQRYPRWFDMRREWVCIQALLFHKILDKFAFEHYEQCYKERGKIKCKHRKF